MTQTPLQIIGPEAEAKLDWLKLGAALEAGHKLPRAEISDSFLYRGKDTLLNRAAWIDGLGLLVKSATIFPENGAQNLAAVNGGAALYSDKNGLLEALVDFHLLTKYKTAGDSLSATMKLARPNSKTILIVGAGTVGHSLRAAYGAGFPEARFLIWNRNTSRAEALARDFSNTDVAESLADAVQQADIVTCATMVTEPILRGEWLKAGQHIDLIGAYRPDMREADDAALKKARIFVDSRATTIEHIGELKRPIAAGVITADDVVADYYDIASGTFARDNDAEITLFKNGGGAHLDLMTAAYIRDAVKG
ncbi:MAG: NAD(P)-binding domain-containing protein [Proteobacteria bacterium]|nr:NAD(P)-binding domain-containing protein [Rhodobacterales bacterium LSUCC0387]MDA0900637.1 NAD(P)-binding domain-containing protein [Pseudomonadota bacterium]NBX42199.1 ornithine cyclodeaminase [Paracoccaceae bacterium]